MDPLNPRRIRPTSPRESPIGLLRLEVSRIIKYLFTAIKEDEKTGRIPPEWTYQALLKLQAAADQFDFDLEARRVQRCPQPKLPVGDQNTEVWEEGDTDPDVGRGNTGKWPSAPKPLVRNRDKL